MSSKQSNRKPPPKLGESRTQPWVKMVVGLLVAALVIGGAVALFADTDDDGSDVSAGAGSTATTAPTVPAPESAAGKPCVAVSDPLPAGAPEVPVAEGPPPTELVVEDLQVGTGAEAVPNATVTVDYIGVACSTGTVFGTTYGQQPASFPLGNVIPGWQQGIPGMKVGGTRLLGIPPDLAYGSEGYPPGTSPDETLWFVVQLKDVQA